MFKSPLNPRVCSSLLVIVAFAGCVNTQIAETNPAKKYPKTSNVEILHTKPTKPYEVIAVLDSVGGVGISEASVVNDMRERAKTIGADAIVVIGAASDRTPQQLMYNPWLGGYQTIGGGEYSKMRAAAIKYSSTPTAMDSAQSSPAGATVNIASGRVQPSIAGRWSGLIRSSQTSQRIRCDVLVEESGKVLYVGDNGVRIDGYLSTSGDRIEGRGIMYMPVNGQGAPLAYFPDSSARAEVKITGIVADAGR